MPDQEENTFSAPFPPSWIDRLIQWLSAQRPPLWLSYLLIILFSAILLNVALWVTGALPIGQFDEENTVFALFIPYWLAFYHHLTRLASSSLKSFRPYLDESETSIARSEYELTKLPRSLGLLAIGLGLVLSVLSIFGDASPYPDNLLIMILDLVVFTGFAAATFFALLIRSVRQLRLVHSLHAQAKKINLFNLEPAHAFSALTSRTALGTVFLLLIAYSFDPEAFQTTLDILITGSTLLLAFAIFAFPIIGIRSRLEDEKSRLLSETSALLKITREKLVDRIKNEEYTDIQSLESAMEELARDQERLQQTSTWPWDPKTIRGFASTLLLPIFIWVITRVLERFL